MIAAAALILGAVLVAWVAPPALHRLTVRGRDPLTAMICWVASIAAVAATFVVGAGMLLLPGDRPASHVASVAHSCWVVLRHGRMPAADEAIGAAGAVLLLVVIARLGSAAARGRHARQRAHRAHLVLFGIDADCARQASRLLWLDHSEPLAYSVGGPGLGLVVATTGLRRLPARQVAAVLCHERAHLRGRHHLLVASAQALAAALPHVPLFRHAPAAMRLLVEFSADAAAVRIFGRHAVRAALLAVNGAAGPDHALAMADGDVTSRLERISHAGPHSGAVRRAFTRGAAALAMVALPAVAGLGTLLLALAMFCPDG